MAFISEDANVRVGTVKDVLVGDASNVTDLRTSILAIAERGITEDDSGQAV